MELSSRSTPHYKWELLALLWLANFLNQGDRQIFNAVLPQIKASMGASDLQMGLVAAIFSVAYGLMMPIAGWLGDSHSRKRIVCVSLLIFSVGTLCTGLASGLILLVLFRSIATGVGESLYTPSALTLIDSQHRETRSLALSLNQTALYIGIVTSSWLAAWIATLFSWRITFLAFGSFGVLLALILALRLKDSEPGSDSQTTAADRPALADLAKVVRQRPTILLLTAAFSCMILGTSGFLTWMPTLLIEEFSFSMTQAAFHAVFIHFLFSFVGVLAGGFLADRFARRLPAIRFHIGTIGLLGCAPFLFLLGSSHDWVMVAIALGAFGFFRGLYDSCIFAALYDVVPIPYRSSVTGLMIACAYGVGALSPLFLGWMKEHAGLGAGLMALAPVTLVGGLILAVATFLRFDRDHVVP